jgi:hypothetical protein
VHGKPYELKGQIGHTVPSACRKNFGRSDRIGVMGRPIDPDGNVRDKINDKGHAETRDTEPGLQACIILKFLNLTGKSWQVFFKLTPWQKFW